MDMATWTIGLLMGAIWGGLLHRMGASQSDNVWNMLRLKDMTLLRYMLVCAAVVMLGSIAFEASGSMTTMVAPTYVWGTIIGGLLLGVGMAFSGYTPTTLLCALGERKLSAFWTFIGGICGVAIFASAYPILLLAMEGWVMDGTTWANFMPLPYSTVALLGAAVCYWVAVSMKDEASSNVLKMKSTVDTAVNGKKPTTTKAKKAS